MLVYTKNLCLVLFHSIIISCYAQDDIDILKIEYEQVLSAYPHNLIEHFPDIENRQSLYIHLGYPGNSNLSSIYTVFAETEEQIQCLKDELDTLALACYHFTDACLLMTNYDVSMFDSTFFHIRQCDNLYPIPNFDFFVEASFPYEFYKNAYIYVLEAEKGRFLEKELLWDKGVGLPKEWEHGYSKGVFISGYIVTYWLEIW